MTIPTEAARMQLIQQSLEVAEKQQGVERARFPWRSSFHTSPVIELPVGSVLLNPKSHRIKAQLESHPKRSAISSDPYADDAQTAIANLLRATPEFDPLRENLKDVKQRDYGIVSHAGLLVNANTRCVALRDIQVGYIRVAVLPADATSEEIDRLELQLQMQQDFRQDYTFSNELLFIHDLLITNQYTDEKVALEMHWASTGDVGSLKRGVEDVQRRVRILATARELQHESGGKLPLTWFDETKQAMVELDVELEKLKKQDPDGARRVRNNRLLGMLAGVGYRELRFVDQSFVGRYLVSSIDEQALFQGRFDKIIAAPKSDPPQKLSGLEIFDDIPVANSAEDNIEPFLGRVASSFGEKRIALIVADGEVVDADRPAVIAQLKEAVEDAAEEAKLAGRNDSLHEKPRRLLIEATKYVRRAGEAYQQVNHSGNFDRNAFKKARQDLSGAIEAVDAMIAADDVE